jgi:ribose transport system substrate-binding protein
VSQYTQPPTKIPLTTPLPSPAPKGKTFVWFQCDLPTCTEIGSGITAATKAIGWNLKVLSYKSSDPATLTAAMNQALQYHPVAVAVSGLPQATWQSEVKVYQQAGIPILPSFIGPNPTSSTVPVNIYSDYDAALHAKLIGNWFIADSKATGNALVVTVPSFPILTSFTDDLTSGIAKDCAGCKTSNLEITIPEEEAGQVTQLVVAALRKDPSANYVLIPDALLVDGLPSALKSAGLTKVKVAGSWGDAAGGSYVKSGAEGAWTGLATPYSGWLDIDAAARLVEKAPLPSTAQYALPTQLLTQSSVGTPANTYDFPADYPSQFQALWHVG